MGVPVVVREDSTKYSYPIGKGLSAAAGETTTNHENGGYGERP